MENVKIELDEPFLKKFFKLTDRVIPEDQEITMAMLRRQLDEIEQVLTDTKAEAAEKKPYSPSQTQPKPSSSSNFSSNPSEDVFNLPKKNILIIDDLGVITYQLEVLFKQFGYDVTTSKEIYDAIDKFKKQPFDLVIMDLFIPTEREGLILLEELKKVSVSMQKIVKIGVMSASSRKRHKQLCKMKGAEFYIEKIDDWQKELCKLGAKFKITIKKQSVLAW